MPSSPIYVNSTPISNFLWHQFTWSLLLPPPPTQPNPLVLILLNFFVQRTWSSWEGQGSRAFCLVKHMGNEGSSSNSLCLETNKSLQALPFGYVKTDVNWRRYLLCKRLDKAERPYRFSQSMWKFWRGSYPKITKENNLCFRMNEPSVFRWGPDSRPLKEPDGTP
jgi:hypothetical protein